MVFVIYTISDKPEKRSSFIEKEVDNASIVTGMYSALLVSYILYFVR